MPRDRQPTTIQLITAPSCANCLKAQRAISAAVDALRGAYPIAFSELSLSEHPELLAQHDIWGTPAVIIDDELAFVGAMNEQQLREKLAAAAGR